MGIDEKEVTDSPIKLVIAEPTLNPLIIDYEY